MASVSLRLPDEVTQRLESLAAFTGRSKTFYMVEAICARIYDLKDLYLAERELEAIRSGKSPTVPLEQLMERHGMEGWAFVAGLKNLGKLDPQIARRVLSFLHEWVAPLDDPRSIGESPKGSRLGEFWKYRVGDCRIISSIQDGALRILVV